MIPGADFGASPTGGFDMSAFAAPSGAQPVPVPMASPAFSNGGLFSPPTGPPQTIRARGTLAIYDKFRTDALVLSRTEQHDCILETPPFGSGACRHAYKLRMPSYHRDAQFVAKKYTQPKAPIEKELEDEFKQAHIAANFAAMFNRYNPPKKGTKYTVEPMLQGQWQKHNNIFGWCESDRCTPAAFAHFTYVASGGQMMVLDVQGCGDLYTDPAVCTRDRRFGFTDFGPDGFTEFRKVHKCNDVCRLMQLQNTPPGQPVTAQLPPPRLPRESAFAPSPTSQSAGGGRGFPPPGGASGAGGGAAGGGGNGIPPPPPFGAQGSVPGRAVSPVSGVRSGASGVSPVGSAPSGAGGVTPSVRGVRRDRGFVFQELVGDIMTTSDPIAVAVPATLDLTSTFLSSFERQFSCARQLKAVSNTQAAASGGAPGTPPRLGTVLSTPRRSRDFYFLVVQTAPGAAVDPTILTTAITALARLLQEKRVTRLSVPEGLGLSSARIPTDTVRDTLLSVFGGVPLTVHCYTTSSGAATGGGGGKKGPTTPVMPPSSGGALAPASLSTNNMFT